ncbi:MAG TPA: hypothetical protein VEO56_04035 [Bacteroidota bacterium]|nr:hypothetical protein [Bacteroidota bacterium]
MDVKGIKEAIKALSVEERRDVGLYILELEKNYLDGAVRSRVGEDLESLSKVLQENLEKLRTRLKGETDKWKDHS